MTCHGERRSRGFFNSLLGLKSPYWRFELTGHQQIALERLRANLRQRALVCYACPAFHTEAVLHKWTVEPKIVEKSTFPDVADLAGHDAWNFSEPGTFGVANAEAIRREAGPLVERLIRLIESAGVTDEGAGVELSSLVDAAKAAIRTESGDSFIEAQFQEGVRDINGIAEDVDLQEGRDEFTAYATMILFCSLHRLMWLVVGRAH
jgi:hypothetical protein